MSTSWSASSPPCWTSATPLDCPLARKPATRGPPTLAGLAKGFHEDQNAVIQVITTPYSSGMNEGRVTDVKLQKRIMAGRAGVPLLRQRVVLIAHLRRNGSSRTVFPW